MGEGTVIVDNERDGGIVTLIIITIIIVFRKYSIIKAENFKFFNKLHSLY